MHTISDSDSRSSSSEPARDPVSVPANSDTPLPIEELAGRPDFPRCARGLYIDIRGIAGVVVDIVNQSLKVRSSDGTTRSYNALRLKTLFAPPPPLDPAPSLPESEGAPTESTEKPTEPPRLRVTDPDFAAPVRPIHDYVRQEDFPQCALGKHVDIAGFTGVVVEIWKGSLRIQPSIGGTRSYNADVLRKLYAKG